MPSTGNQFPAATADTPLLSAISQTPATAASTASAAQTAASIRSLRLALIDQAYAPIASPGGFGMVVPYGATKTTRGLRPARPLRPRHGRLRGHVLGRRQPQDP